MGTKNFNFIDSCIAHIRLRHIEKYIDPNDTILDFGCGYQAYFLKHVQNRILSGYGIDYEVENYNYKNLHLSKFRYIKALPFKKNTFDKVFMIAVIEHLHKRTFIKLISEMFRVLKPNGLVIFTTPTPKSKPILEFLANSLHIISSAEVMDHKKYYDYPDLCCAFCQKGLFKPTYYQTFMIGLNSFGVFRKYV